MTNIFQLRLRERDQCNDDSISIFSVISVSSTKAERKLKEVQKRKYYLRKTFLNLDLGEVNVTNIFQLSLRRSATNVLMIQIFRVKE